jgi:hypothetical protein
VTTFRERLSLNHWQKNTLTTTDSSESTDRFKIGDLPHSLRRRQGQVGGLHCESVQATLEKIKLLLSEP